MSPSAPARRAPVVALALLGAAISTYLALYQVDVLGSVWEPLFGDGSRHVLHSELSRLLPVPDSSLGIAGYLTEAGLEAIGGRERFRAHPRLVLALGAAAAGMAVASAFLVAYQLLAVREACTLCLASAAVSWCVPLLVREEVRAAWAVLRRESGRTLPV